MGYFHASCAMLWFWSGPKTATASNLKSDVSSCECFCALGHNLFFRVFLWLPWRGLPVMGPVSRPYWTGYQFRAPNKFHCLRWWLLHFAEWNLLKGLWQWKPEEALWLLSVFGSIDVFLIEKLVERLKGVANTDWMMSRTAQMKSWSLEICQCQDCWSFCHTL